MKYAILPRRLLTLSAAAIAFGLPLGSANAAGILAGTDIQNTATATYSTGATTETISSNTVTITVDELLDVSVASLDGGNVAIGAGGAVLTFELQNTGNGTEAFEIVVDAAIAGDDFDPDVTQIAYDSNGNGIYDAGVDIVIPAGGATPLVDPDDTLRLFVVNSLPGGVADGATADVRLTALAVTGNGAPGTLFAGQGDGGVDAVVGASSAEASDLGTLFAQTGSVALTKSATIADPFGGAEALPGSLVTYSLRAVVSGSGSVSSLVVSDSIPSGTTYQTGTLKLDGSDLTDAAGDDEGEASASGIAVDLGTVAGGATHTITFSVEID